MYQAVCKLERHHQSELTELIMSLPKRERAMCLFNSEVLRAKLADAKLVLESDEAEEEEQQPTPVEPSSVNSKAAQLPVTPQAKKVASGGVSRTAVEEVSSPRTPELSSRGASAAASPMPTTPSGGSSSTATAATYTVTSLAKLSAVEIVKIASDVKVVLPVPRADPIVVQTTNEFVDSLKDKPIQQQKQQLGDKLFKVIKSFGVKGAPKITIALLDQEDLRALAHLMNSYPAVLKDKVLNLTLPK